MIKKEQMNTVLTVLLNLKPDEIEKLKENSKSKQLSLWPDLKKPHVSNQSPYTCPICNGRGNVPPGFYNVYTNTSFNSPAELCKTCGGSGVLWN